jgi:hypothetical protein
VGFKRYEITLILSFYDKIESLIKITDDYKYNRICNYFDKPAKFNFTKPNFKKQ